MVADSDDEGKPLLKRQKLSDFEIENIVMGVEHSDLPINIHSTKTSQTAISLVE